MLCRRVAHWEGSGSGAGLGLVTAVAWVKRLALSRSDRFYERGREGMMGETPIIPTYPLNRVVHLRWIVTAWVRGCGVGAWVRKDKRFVGC